MGEAGAQSEGDAGAGDLRVQTLTADPAALRPGVSATWTASVHHPEGPQAIVSGTLRDDAGEGYGNFERTQAGDFVLTLSWAQIQATRTIRTPAGGGERTFTATFEDAAGRKASASVDVALLCPAAQDAVCDGVCADLQTSPQHCGACGEVESGDLQCVGGALVCDGGRTRCGDACREAFQACGGCTLDCRDYVDAAYANGVGVWDASRACRSDRCYFVALRFWDTTAIPAAPPESCSAICARAGMRCAQRHDISAVGTEHHHTLRAQLASCDALPRSQRADPDQPMLSYFLTRVECGCESIP